MPYHLGVDLGTTYTAAAIFEGGRATVTDLSSRTATMPSIVFLDTDGTFLVGDAAIRRAATEPARAAQQFKRRFGDTTPLFLGGSPFSADALTAELLKSVIELVTSQQGGPPSSVALTYPANWGGYKLELLEQAIRQANLSDVTTMTEPEAAVLHYAQLERVPTGAVVAVFDLGGGTFDAAVVRKTENGTEFLGRPEGIERLGGIDFDDAIFAFVREHLAGSMDELNLDDPTTRTALERLRRECTEAKEALSADEAASIPVFLPNVQTTIRITRSEFESLIRPPLNQAIGALHRALESAGVQPSDLDAVLLAGGSSRIPLVSEMAGNELARPVAVDTHPKHVVAMGAALAASQDAPGAGAAATAAAAAPPAAPAAEPVQAAPEDVAPTQAEPKFAEPATVAAPAAVAAAAPTSAPAAASPAGNSTRKIGLIAAIVAGLAALGVVGFLVLGGSDDSGTNSATDQPAATVAGNDGDTDSESADGGSPGDTGGDEEGSDSEPAAAPDPTATPVPTATPEPTPTPEPTATPVPTATPEPTATPVPLFPAETRQVVLNAITNNNGIYEIGYDTLNFEPFIGGGSFHIHFHWDIYAPESVGSASNPQGSWSVWDLRFDGQKIFDGFSAASAPSGASGICAVVATAGHAVDAIEYAADTVSCIDLPA